MADNTQVSIDLTYKLLHKEKLKILEQDTKKVIAQVNTYAKQVTALAVANSKIEVQASKEAAAVKVAMLKKETEEKKANVLLQKLEYQKSKDEEKRLAKQSVQDKKQVDKEKLESEKAWQREKQRLDRESADKQKQVAKQIAEQIKRDNELVARSQQRALMNSFAQPQKQVVGKSTFIGDMFSKDYFTAQLKGYTQLMNSVSQGNPKWQEYKNKVDSVKSSLQAYNSVKKLSIFQLAEFGENITVVTAGIMAAISGIVSLGKESVQLAAKFNVLRSNFKGTDEDLQLFRQATAGTVSDANLIRLSNQAEDLGVSLKDQALLFSLAEDAGDKYGGSVEENFQRVVMATEGNIKGLKALGIQKAEYEQMVQTLVKAHGGEVESIQGVNGEREINIKKLDAETQKQIRLNAILKLTGITLNDVKNKTQDQADKLEALSVRVEEAKTKFGNFLLTGVEPLITGFLNLGDAGSVVVGGLSSIISAAVPLASTIAQLNIAFPNLAKTVTSSTIAMASAWTAMVGAILLGAQQIRSNLGIDLFSGNIISNIQNLATSDFMVNRGIDKGIESMKKTGMDKPITDRLLQDALKTNDKKYETFSKLPKNLPTTSKGGKSPVQQETEDIDILAKAVRDLKVAYEQTTDKAMKFLEPMGQEGRGKLRPADQFKGAQSALVAFSDTTKSLIEEIDSFINVVASGISGLFEGLIAGDTVDALKGFLKNIVNAFITSVQAMIFAAGGAAAAKGITTFGLSLITDLPELAAAWVALEAAKGVISGFAQGGYVSGAGTSTSDSIPAMLSNGEFVVNAAATRSNLPLLSAINNNANFTPAMATPVNNVYIYSEIDGVTFLKKNYPKYQTSKRAVRV